MDKNEITGDSLVSKPTTNKFREGWDRIFGTKSTPNELNSKENKDDSACGCRHSSVQKQCCNGE